LAVVVMAVFRSKRGNATTEEDMIAPAAEAKK
jgi:hypothetical protein